MQNWWNRHKDAFPMEFTPEQKNVIEDLTGRVPLLLKPLLDVDLSLPDVISQGALTEVSDSTSGDAAGTSEEENEENHLRNWQRVCDHLWASPEVENVVSSVISVARASRRNLHSEVMKM
jgi:hypothetical protein